MKSIIKKQICFEKSLYYFKKDKSVYNPADCHINTYLKFYDQNYEEVERREDDFKYVTGLMVCYHDNNKYCFVHSWVEDNGMIIDTTVLANSILKILDDFSIIQINEIKEILEKQVCYIPYYELSNNLFTLQCQELYTQCGCNPDKTFKIIENYLGSIVQSVERDNDFIAKVKNDFGCKLKKDYLCFGIK